MAKKKATKNTHKQSHIEGTEPPRVPAIDKLAVAYQEVRDERIELTEQEVDQRSKLLVAMREHKLDRYQLPDSDVEVVVLAGEDKVKVRKVKPADPVEDL
jgi:hypothetical protein